MLAVLAVVASLLVAAAAALVLGLTVVFGSSGFGGDAIDRSTEAVRQAVLLGAVLAPLLLVGVRGPWRWLVVVAQVIVVVAVFRLAR